MEMLEDSIENDDGGIRWRVLGDLASGPASTMVLHVVIGDGFDPVELKRVYENEVRPLQGRNPWIRHLDSIVVKHAPQFSGFASSPDGMDFQTWRPPEWDSIVGAFEVGGNIDIELYAGPEPRVSINIPIVLHTLL